LDISDARKSLRPLVCEHCGFCASPSNAIHEEMEKKTIFIMAGISAVILLAFIQLNRWDKYWLSTIPLSLKETIGMASPADAESRAAMCFDLKKWDCTEAAYVRTSLANPALWERTADFEMKRGKFNEAAQSFYKYFQSGAAPSLDASYKYAKALAAVGQVDDAIKYFDQVLASKPGVLQVTVIHSYVKLLVDHQRYNQAKLLIENVRKNGGEGAGAFMEADLQKITTLNTAAR
jgi:tetratricopeptide (TPR) repeat protein